MPALQPTDAQLDKAQKLIAHLDPDIGYTEWVKVGMVLHYLSDGTDEGLDIWIDWSSQGDKFPVKTDIVLMQNALAHDDVISG